MAEKIPTGLLKRVKRANGDEVKAEEVLSWGQSETHVVVVTADGQKLIGEKS